MDREAFSKIMSVLEVIFDKVLSLAAMEAYYKALADLTIEEFERAAGQAQATCKFFPKPAELREFVQASGDDAAAVAWANLDRAIAHGPGPSLYLQDGAAGYALKTVFHTWPTACEQLHPVFGPAPVSWEEREAARLERRNPDEGGASRQIGGLSPEMIASKRKEFLTAYRNGKRTGQRVHYFIGRDYLNNQQNLYAFRDRFLAAGRSTFPVDLIAVTDEVVIRDLPLSVENGQIASEIKSSLEAGKFEIPAPVVHRLPQAEQQKALPAGPPLTEEENKAMSEDFQAGLKEFIAKKRIAPPTLIAGSPEYIERMKHLQEQAKLLGTENPGGPPTMDAFPE